MSCMRIGGYARAMLCVTVLAVAVGQAGAQSITINRSTEYQTIDGLGGFACLKEAKVRNGPFYIDAPMGQHYDSLCNDLGVSMVRYEVAPTYQTSAGGAYNTSGGVFCGPTMSGNLTMIREFAARGVTRNLFTVWSPPAYMKPIGTIDCGAEAAPDYNSTLCKLDPARYEDFGRFMVAYLKAVRDSTGVAPYAVSLQNELRFSQTFNSCVYNSSAYRSVHRTAAPIIRTDFPNVRFVGNEDLTGWYFDNWMAEFLNDGTVSNYLYALALHYGSSGGYSSAWNVANQHGRKVWGTEEQHDAGGLMQAQRIHWALTNGNASSWIIWVLSTLFDGGGDGNSRLPTPSYAACKHYFRFVRPGAVRVGVSGGTSTLQVSAYKHTTENTNTVVIINTASSAANVTVGGTGLPSTFYVYRTDATNLCIRIGTATTGSSISIPASSITTLYSEDITGVKPAPSTLAPSRRVPFAGPARVFTLDGRQARGGSGVAPALGVRVVTEGAKTYRDIGISGR